MYGWVQRNEAGFAVKAAVKKLVDGVDARQQEVVTGTFWFKDKATFLREHQAMLAANDRVNNEFYIDTIARRMIDAGRKVRAFTVRKYIPWGTPEELRTFQYWNDVFRSGRTL
jgi:bifunctional N-acetylglucosamine-1-phosphate-uridyltransferase/glucosamine-1-phosphate-acetyltransferase GlmU-like protein